MDAIQRLAMVLCGLQLLSLSNTEIPKKKLDIQMCIISINSIEHCLMYCILLSIQVLITRDTIFI